MTVTEWLQKYNNDYNVPRVGFGFNEFVDVVKNQGWDKNLAPIVITVGGTNGKGSCIAALDALFSESKCDVLSFTSPHLSRINERFIWQQKQITDETLLQAINYVKRIEQEHYNFSFFEFTTLMVFYLSKYLKPDVLLLEVGLGGRLDAVNATLHNCAVITSIDLDHQDILGKNINDITYEKSGIIKPNVPIVWGGGTKVPTIIIQRANKINAQCINKPHIRLSHAYLSINSLHAAYLAWSYFKPTNKNALAILSQLKLPGRFEIVNKYNKTWILDVAHNPAACKNLAVKVKKYKNLHIIVTFAKNKDIKSCLKCFANVEATWHLAPQLSARHITYADLQTYIDSCRFVSLALDLNNIISKKSIKHILVFGSFNLISWVKQNF